MQIKRCKKKLFEKKMKIDKYQLGGFIIEKAKIRMYNSNYLLKGSYILVVRIWFCANPNI